MLMAECVFELDCAGDGLLYGGAAISFFLGIAVVAKGVRQVREWIEGSFGVNELVLFDERSREGRVRFVFVLNGVGLIDGNGTRCGEGFLQFIEEVGSHDLVGELDGAFAFEGEPFDFKADFVEQSGTHNSWSQLYRIPRCDR